MLYGVDPQTFLPLITPDILHQALVREVGFLRHELCSEPDSEWRDKLFYRVYAVLTLCRIPYSARTGEITSKTDAAQWALSHIPSEWHELIGRALAGGQSSGLDGFPMVGLRAFLEFTQEQVDAEAPSD